MDPRGLLKRVPGDRFFWPRDPPKRAEFSKTFLTPGRRPDFTEKRVLGYVVGVETPPTGPEFQLLGDPQRAEPQKTIQRQKKSPRIEIFEFWEADNPAPARAILSGNWWFL